MAEERGGSSNKTPEVMKPVSKTVQVFLPADQAWVNHGPGAVCGPLRF